MAVGIGYGSKIQVNDGASASYADFENVTQITVPVQEQAEVESTHLESANRFREYVVGLIDPGSCEFTSRFTDAEYDRLVDLRGVSKSFKIIFPDTSSAVFSGFIRKTELEIQNENVIDMKTTIRVSGSVTFTTA